MPIANLDSTRQAQGAPSALHEATVLSPPLDANGWLRVEVDDQPGVVKVVPYQPRVDLEIRPGDAAVVMESDAGNSWALLWWSQSGLVPTPPSGGGGSELAGHWNWTTSTTTASSKAVGINTAAWNTATQINLSETTDPGADVSNIIGALQSGDGIYVQDANDSTKWARYRVTAVPTDQGTWRSIPVSYINGGAALPANNRDTLVIFQLSGGAAGGDKNYVHTQGSAAASWTVTHSLGKFPTIAVVDSGNNVLIPDVHYVDTNSLTVSFAGPTSGKAYCN